MISKQNYLAALNLFHDREHAIQFKGRKAKNGMLNVDGNNKILWPQRRPSEQVLLLTVGESGRNRRARRS